MYSSSELIVRSCGYRTPFATLAAQTVTGGPDRAGTCQKPAMAAGNHTEVRAKLARIGSARTGQCRIAISRLIDRDGRVQDFSFNAKTFDDVRKHIAQRFNWAYSPAKLTYC